MLFAQGSFLVLQIVVLQLFLLMFVLNGVLVLRFLHYIVFLIFEVYLSPDLMKLNIQLYFIILIGILIYLPNLFRFGVLTDLQNHKVNYYSDPYVLPMFSFLFQFLKGTRPAYFFKHMSHKLLLSSKIQLL